MNMKGGNMLRTHHVALAIGWLCFSETTASAPPPECKIDKVDTVIVTNGEKDRIMGALEYSMGTDGEYTGTTGRAKPAGPSIVLVIKNPSPAALEAIRKVNPEAHDGAVYQWPKGSPLQDMRYLCDVDTTLDPEQLAALFGVQAGQRPSPPPEPAER
jgi:hypothetical protein